MKQVWKRYHFVLPDYRKCTHQQHPARLSNVTYQIMKEIGITSSSTQLGINGGMKSFSLVTNMGMSFLADKMGRRPMYLISVSGVYHTL